MLYRVEAASPKQHAATSRRPPVNVPYVVDNLWEWARPEELPSRRGCSYASPSPASAWRNASTSGSQRLVQLHFQPAAAVVQLAETDARLHPDCTRLRKHLLALLDQHCTVPAYPNWASQPLHLKQSAAALFLPAVSRAELHELLGPGGPLGVLAEELRPLITLWQTAQVVYPATGTLPYADGEVFFQPTAVEQVIAVDSGAVEGQ